MPTPLPGFIGPSYTLRALSYDAQRTVNLYPELGELGTGKNREIAALVGTPGLQKIVTIQAPNRGLYTAGNGRVFAVNGTKLYEITVTTALDSGTLATGSGPVSIADNGVDLLIVDGVKGYTFNFATSIFAQITDPDFPVASSCAFVDQYLVVNQVGTRNFYVSNLASASDWDSLDFSAKEGAPDVLQTLLVDHREIWLFGLISSEVWFDAGGFDFPFERREFLEYGIIGDTARKIDNTVFWVSRDQNGQAIGMRADGYAPRRFTTHAIEQAIATYGDISGATAYTMQLDGHSFYVLNFPNAPTTWVFDASTGLWHERQSWKAGGGFGRHRVQNHTFSGGYHIAGDYENGNLYLMKQEVYSDDGNEIPRIRRSPHASNNGSRITAHSFQLDMETGRGLPTGQGSDPQVMLRVSKDGGHSWGNELWVSAGKQGDFRHRALWRRLGIARDWVFETTISDPIPVTLISALVELEPMRS